MDSRVPYQAKLVLLGDMGAGKSSIVLRFVKGQFHDYQESTIGAAFLTKTMPDDNLRFEIWDTAGQERYASLAPMYYRGAAAAVVVYDITSKHSFQKAQSWVQELQQKGSPDMVVTLAGNKIDLQEERQVSPEEGQEYADSAGLLFMEVSAKSATNVEELFKQITAKLPRTETPALPHGGIALDQQQGTRGTSSCCAQ